VIPERCSRNHAATAELTEVREEEVLVVLLEEPQVPADLNEVLWLRMEPIESQTADLPEVATGGPEMRQSVLHFVDQPERTVLGHGERLRECRSRPSVGIVDQADTRDASTEWDSNDLGQSTRPIRQVGSQNELGSHVGYGRRPRRRRRAR